MSTVYPLVYPTLNIDLSTQQGRQECYDVFTHYCIKTDQYYGFNSSFILKLFGKQIDQAKRRMLVINSTTSTYKVLREVFFGPNWMESMDFVSANSQLNQLLDNVSVKELYEKLGNYLKDKQQKALLEPPNYETKVPL